MKEQTYDIPEQDMEEVMGAILDECAKGGATEAHVDLTLARKMGLKIESLDGVSNTTVIVDISDRKKTEFDA